MPHITCFSYSFFSLVYLTYLRYHPHLPCDPHYWARSSSQSVSTAQYWSRRAGRPLRSVESEATKPFRSQSASERQGAYDPTTTRQSRAEQGRARTRTSELTAVSEWVSQQIRVVKQTTATDNSCKATAAEAECRICAIWATDLKDHGQTWGEPAIKQAIRPSFSQSISQSITQSVKQRVASQ